MTSVTGYKIREAIKLHEMRKDVLQNQFEESLVQFADDNKGDPKDLAQKIREEELAVAALQVAQTFYNLKVEVRAGSIEMSLCDAVKQMGGAGRMEQLWNKVAKAGSEDRRYRRHGEMSRDPNQERAKSKITALDALTEATKAAKFAAQLRAAIAEGNSQEVEVPDLAASLLL